MGHSYIKFSSPTSNTVATTTPTKRILKKLIVSVVTTFVPKANPDYDVLIDTVHEWLLEINIEDKKPNREIGIDKYGQTLLIMPWRNNYGYWSDNNITYDYFKEAFKAVDIEKVEFEIKWDAFIKQESLQESYEFDKRGFSKYYRHLEQSGWTYDGYMTFAKGKEKILFDTSEAFYIENIDSKVRKEFQCKNINNFINIIQNHTSC